MQSDHQSQNKDTLDQEAKTIRVNSASSTTSSHIVTADAVQAEEVPTIPLGSLQTLSTLQPEVSVHAVDSDAARVMPAPLVVQPSEYRRGIGEWLQLWWEGIRPGYLPLSLLPVILGSVLAWTQSISTHIPRGTFHPLRFVVLLIAVLLLQAGAHLVNDYYDHIRGIDRSNSLGPGGLIQQALLNPRRVLSLGLASLIVGTALGIVVASAAGLLFLVFLVIGALCAYFYSATARALSSLALGELVSFCIFGPLLVLASYVVQTGQVSRTALLYSLPLGLLAAAIILSNDMRDIESDSQAGKHTLAYILGLKWSRALYVVLLFGAYAPVIALAVPRGAPHLLLIVLWTLPLAMVALTGAIRTQATTGFHLVMRETLKIEIYFTLLLVAALIVSTFMGILPHLPIL
ncbi:MAG TPA: 1,4-dihydroxy-2-naphthoate octaprenyltransferase [Ktedonobacteraceae bacterium]|jgi:1,4-dihydroxy-2-naphthoate octaprenyltransferase|nr:1,4-dihydroxy-2-naphthoate octaprenyltransferase [Ktedonobacteraceae bacterium]